MHEMTAVEDLKSGDHIDLENDQYADPFGFNGTERDPEDGSDEATHMYLECEYAVVEDTEEESETITVVYTDEVNVGFPHGHKVRRYVPSDEEEANLDVAITDTPHIDGQPVTFEVLVDAMPWADQDGVTRWNRSDADEIADRLESNGNEDVRVRPVTE